MRKSIDATQLENAFQRGQVQWQRHSLEQMMKRDIAREAVRQVILKGERIEDYPDDWPLPSALFFSWIGTRPIHVVAAFDDIAQLVYIITAYEATLDYFTSDYRTRREK